LGRAFDGSKGRGMYGFLGVVGARGEALQDWVLAMDWLEWGSEEINLSFKYPWWGEKGNVGRE